MALRPAARQRKVHRPAAYAAAAVERWRMAVFYGLFCAANIFIVLQPVILARIVNAVNAGGPDLPVFPQDLIRLANGVRGHPDYGDDSPFYTALGFVPHNEIRSGRPRKPR